MNKKLCETFDKTENKYRLQLLTDGEINNLPVNTIYQEVDPIEFNNMMNDLIKSYEYKTGKRDSNDDIKYYYEGATNLDDEIFASVIFLNFINEYSEFFNKYDNGTSLSYTTEVFNYIRDKYLSKTITKWKKDYQIME